MRHASRFVKVPICRVRLAGWQTKNLSKTYNSDNDEEVKDVNTDRYFKGKTMGLHNLSIVTY